MCEGEETRKVEHARVREDTRGMGLYMYANDTKIYVIGNSVDDIVVILKEVLDQVNT